MEDVFVNYEETRVLRGVSFIVRQGDIVALIGPNGAGKSTVLRAIAGVVRPAVGQIRFECRAIAGLPTDSIVRRGISLVPQGRRLFPGLTVLENLEMGAVASRSRSWRDDVEVVFNLFPALRQHREQRAWALSGGQQQMVAIGRALMAKPKLLLLDEPSLGLAPLLVVEMFDRIQEINRNGTTVLLAEQNARMALRIAARGLVLTNGRVALEGAASILGTDDRVRILFLGGTVDA